MKIDGKGIKLQSHILEKITAFPNKLVDKKQVQSFLGILNYASDFIKNLAELRKTFQNLPKSSFLLKLHYNIYKSTNTFSYVGLKKSIVTK